MLEEYMKKTKPEYYSPVECALGVRPHEIPIKKIKWD